MPHYQRKPLNQGTVRRIINRRRRVGDATVPRAVRGISAEQLARIPLARFGKRRRKATRKRAEMEENEVRYGSGWLPMYRTFDAVRYLFHWAGARAPEEIVAEKVRALGKTRKCVVLDIGSGVGAALGTMMVNPKIEPIHQKIEFHGIDLLKINPREAPELILHQGNILTEPFPKADLVFSQITAGYAGHIGFLVKKTARALHEKGVAVLHVNAHGTPAYSETPAPILIQGMKKLQENLEKIKIPGCSIRIKRDSFMSVGYFGRDDIVIVVEKE